jgi:predicted nucleic acid-binding protein
VVLVDSAVWIDLLRNQATPQTVILRKLLEDNTAALAPVVYQEILQGAASAERLAKLRKYFSTLPFLLPAHPIKTYEKAAELYAHCRFRGYTPRSPHDCLVARIAIEHNVRLLQDDRDFDTLASIESKLKLFAVTKKPAGK